MHKMMKETRRRHNRAAMMMIVSEMTDIVDVAKVSLTMNVC